MSYTQGLAAEHTAISKLLRAGRHLAQPLNSQEKYDLLLWDYQTVRVGPDDYAYIQAWSRVQIKRAYKTKSGYRVDLRAWSGRKNRRLYARQDLEYLCVVVEDEVYLIPWHVVWKKQSFTMTDELRRYAIAEDGGYADPNVRWPGPLRG